MYIHLRVVTGIFTCTDRSTITTRGIGFDVFILTRQCYAYVHHASSTANKKAFCEIGFTNGQQKTYSDHISIHQSPLRVIFKCDSQFLTTMTDEEDDLLST